MIENINDQDGFVEDFIYEIQYKINEMIKSENVSYNYVATELGVTEEQLTDFLNGQGHNITLSLLAKISFILNRYISVNHSKMVQDVI